MCRALARIRSNLAQVSLQKSHPSVPSCYHPSMVAEHGCFGDEAETVDAAVPQILEGTIEESLKGDLAETKRSLAADETLTAKLAENGRVSRRSGKNARRAWPRNS